MTTMEWSYDDSTNWGENCNEFTQSPINIDTGIADSCKDLCELKIMYKPSSCRVKYDKHQNLKLIIDNGSTIIYKNNPYNLKEITFHTPSLHHIDGIKYDLEVCLIHSIDDNPYSSNGVVISCLFNEGTYYGKSERFIHQFINDIKINSETEVNVSKEWGANMLLPERKSFYIYKGSLPFPPCSNTTNIVMDNIGNISPVNLELLILNLGKNIRPVQALGGRNIYYNSGKIITLKSENRTIKHSNNKYFRCKPKPKNSIKNTKTIKNNDNKESTDKDTINIEGMSDKTKKFIKNFFLLLTVFSIFIHSIFLCKYLFKYEIAQKLIIAIVGAERLGGGDILKTWRESAICS